jgi:hypothetical protein
MKKGNFIIAAGILSLIFFLANCSATVLTQCGSLQNNTAYTLNSNITGNTSGICFSAVTNSNITFDCQGNSIVNQNMTYGLLIRTSTNITLQNCNFYNWGYGVSARLNNGLYFYNNNFYSNGSGQYQVYTSDQNFILQNNTFNSVNGLSFKDIYFYYYAGTVINNVTIKNNIFNIGTSPIDFETPSGLANFSNLNITGNTFNSSGTGLSSAIGFNPNSTGVRDNISITNNIFLANYSSAMLIKGAGENSNVYVFNNTLGSSSQRVNITSGVLCYNCSNSSFLNNTMYAYDINGIVAESGSNYLIDSNVIDMSSDGLRNGISCGVDNNLLAQKTNCTISNNNVTCPRSDLTGRHAIVINYMNDSTISGNNISGGYYGLVVKGTNRARAFNNRVINSSYVCIYNKAGWDDHIFSNYLEQNANENWLIYISQNPADGGRYTINSTWRDNVLVRNNNNTVNIIGMEINSTATFVNMSYNTSREWIRNSNSNVSLTKKWYFTGQILADNGTAIEGANISIYNNSGSLEADVLSSSDGSIEQQELTEYFKASGDSENIISYYSNYTINITKTGFSSLSYSLNMTNNTNLTFTMSENVAPEISINSPSSAQVFSSNSALLNITLNENGTCLYSINSGATNLSMDSEDNLTFTKTLSSLSNGDYIANFYCNDSLGNRNDTENVSFTIAVASQSAPASSSYGSIIYIGNETLMSEYTKNLGIGWKLGFKIKNQSHELMIDSIKNNLVLLTIQSKPLKINLTVGEEKKLDLDNDDYYDLFIRLNSILYTANLTIKEINEKIQNSSSDNDKLNKEVAEEQELEKESKKSWVNYLGMFLTIIIVLIGGFLIYGANKKKHLKNYYKMYHKIHYKR